MYTLLIFSILITAAYYTLIIWQFGVPASLSESFYLLNARRRHAGWLFTVWCYATALAVMALLLDFSDGKWYQFLAFLAGAGLAFAGASPMFKGYARYVHYTATGICALAVCALAVASGYLYLPGIFIPAACFVGSAKGHLLFWIETALILMTYTLLI